MEKILLLNGPNLNLLGMREPGHYGTMTLTDVNADLTKLAKTLQLTFTAHQSNAEHQLIDHVHATLQDKTDFIIINPGALTHTSIALRDALLAVKVPFIEVHLSNIHARDAFRQHSYFSDIAVGVISGLGSYGYELALHAAKHYLQHRTG